MAMVEHDLPRNSDSACRFIGVVVVEDAGNGDGGTGLTWGQDSSSGSVILQD